MKCRECAGTTRSSRKAAAAQLLAQSCKEPANEVLGYNTDLAKQTIEARGVAAGPNYDAHSTSANESNKRTPGVVLNKLQRERTHARTHTRKTTRGNAHTHAHTHGKQPKAHALSQVEAEHSALP